MEVSERLPIVTAEANPLCAGREMELGRIRALYDDAVTSRSGRLALVTGAAGVGKSRLLAEALRRFRAEGVPVFEGRCRSGGLPYEPFVDLAQGALAALAEQGAGGPRLERAAMLCATLRGKTAIKQKAKPRDGGDKRIEFFEHVRELFCDLARPRPPVLLIHDAHLADGATRALLAFLARTLAPAPGLALEDDFSGLFVVATRETDPPVWLDDVAADRISLTGLDRDGVRAYLASPQVVDGLLRASGGMPQRLQALLDQGLPDDVTLAERRLATLSPAAARLCRALAIYGSPAGADLLDRFGAELGASPSETAAAIRELADCPLLTRSVAGGELRLGFTAGVDRDIVAGGGEGAVAIHRAIGETLLAAGDQNAAADHLLSGDAGEHAVDAALAAGEALERSLAYERAAALYARALAATRRDAVAARLDERLADLYELCGDYARALDSARRLAARHPDDAAAEGRIGHLLLVRGEFAAARAALARARDLAEVGRDSAILVQILADAAEAHFLDGEHEAALADAEAALQAPDAPARGRIAARNAAGKVWLEQGDYDRAARAFGENLGEARAAALGHEVTRALINLGISALRRGDYGAAEQHYREGLAAARESGDLRHRAFCLQNLGVLAQWRRDYAVALSSYQGAVQAFKRLGHRPWLSWVALDLGDLYLGLGDARRADAMAELAGRLQGETAPPTAAVILENLRGRVAQERGEHGRARGLYESALTRARRIGNRDELSITLLHLARLDLVEGRPDNAVARLAEVPAPMPAKIEAQLLCIRAESAMSAGALAAARRDLAGAERAWQGIGDEEGRLRALLLGAVAAERMGDSRAGRQARDAAREIDSALRRRVPDEFAECYGTDPLRAALSNAAAPAPVTLAPAGKQVRGYTWKLVGDSQAMRHAKEMIERVAPHDSLVLIRGESGTGKELCAEAIHDLSPRRGRPFVKVNCGALVESLLLSELFGHERGAFTGALARRKGRFELADGGTIFLDEIGDISPQTQVALLRVLQERVFERVGGTQSLRVDVRILCATNRDLEAMVAGGRFREDLYYRLKGLEVEMPPLRGRGADIGELARHFLRQVAREHGGATPKRLADSAVTAMAAHSWPGNVRELENVIRSVTLLADGEEVDASDLSVYLAAAPPARGDSRRAGSVADRPAMPAPEPGLPAGVAAATGSMPGDLSDIYGRALASGLSLRELKRRIELECITRALTDAGGNITRAAERLGMKRPRLSQLLKEHGIKEQAIARGEDGR